MKKIVLFLLLATTGFSTSLVLENRTSHPTQNSKIAVQWAFSAKEVDEGNKALLDGARLPATTLQTLAHIGKVKLAIPKNAEYFRVLAWSKGGDDPDLHTNWVEAVPNKTYTLQADHLVPTVLMSGMGC